MSIKLSDSTDLEQIIIELDNFLSEGYLKQKDYIHQYKVQSKKRNFLLEDFINEKKVEFDKWYGEVFLFFYNNFKEKYHFFHFVKQRKTALAIPDIPEQLSSFIMMFESHLFSLEDIILRLAERRNLAIRQEIAEKEYQADILYQITFSEHTRIIKLNNIQLANPKFDSKAMNFFEYVYPLANTPLEVKKIEEDTEISFADNIQDILRDLGFTGTIRQLFFPVATKRKVLFINPITKKYAMENELPVIDFSKLTRQNEK